jgi:hypothetical protein
MTVAPTWSRPEVLGFRDVAAVMELLRAREGTHLHFRWVEWVDGLVVGKKWESTATPFCESVNWFMDVYGLLRHQDEI